MPVEEVGVVLSKYDKIERNIDDLLQTHFAHSHQTIANGPNETDQNFPTEAQAIERNAKLLNELKTVKSKLRSKAIYSPVEMRWEEICSRYLENPSLPVTSWKCRLPVFV